MATLSTVNEFWAVHGNYLPIVAPDGITSQWYWQIVDPANPSSVFDYKASLLPSSQRHDFAPIDDRYSVDTEYEVRVKDSGGSVLASGSFRVIRAVFGPSAVTNWSAVNQQIELALGLAGLNSKRIVNSRDSATGIPLDVDIEIYTDETLTTLLASFKLLRKLDKVSRVVAEVQFPTVLP
jgi:hypothetical protein